MNRYQVEFEGFIPQTVMAENDYQAIVKAKYFYIERGFRSEAMFLMACERKRDYRLINHKTTRLNRCVFAAIVIDIATVLSFKGGV